MSDTQAPPTLMPHDAAQQNADQPPPPRSRRRRRGMIALAVAAVAAVAVTAALLIPRGSTITYLTEPAWIGDLEERVEAAASLTYAEAATADLRARIPGVVTVIRTSEGQTPAPLATLLDLDGVPLTGLVSPIPLYRDLEEGAEGDDVRALETALVALGHDPGATDGVFDGATAEALRQWQADNGLEQSGTLPLNRALWLPPGAQVIDVQVRPGDTVQAGTLLAAVARADGRVVTAAVDPADVRRVQVDDAVDVELDGLDEPLTGTVTDVAPTAGDDGTFPVTVQVDALPETVRVGMEGTASVRVDVREDVVVIPVGAVSGTDEAPSVRVLVDGEPETRAVQLGLVTPEGAEVVEGMAEGDAAIVGEREG